MRFARRIRSLVFAVVLLAMSSAAFAGVFISVNFGPPALPVYQQPPCPAEGYIWAPGYWAYGPYGYYWVPGTWVLAPQPGYLWTPGYWAYDGGPYYWHPGYWGPTVGYYGGIPYGYGYTGNGYYGGYWRENHFYYNQSVNNVTTTNVTNVYNTTVINNNTTTVNRVSYNGGPGGIVASPTPAQKAEAEQKHIDPTPAQMQHETTAQSNPQLRASVNQGRPPIAATAKPGEFTGHSVVAASSAGAPYKAPANRPASNVSNVPRPGNNAQAQTEHNIPAPSSNVPRPPSASNGESESRPASTPAEQGASRPSVPRPPSSYQPAAPSRESEPATENSQHGANVPRPDTAPRPEPGATQRESGPGSAYPDHPEAAPAREGEPRPQTEPRQEQAPHPESEPRPEPSHDRPPI
jgi:hypothetical protein